MIKNIIFDFGGVIITLDQPEAIRRFASLGLPAASSHLDAYTQGGIFGAVEEGRIDAETFRRELSLMCSRELTWDECRHAWLGYKKELPARNLEMLKRLRREGYRLILLSNTNPYMMSWAMTPEFSRGVDAECMAGRPVCDYFDAVYLSYEVGCMKPDRRFFAHVLEHEGIKAGETIFLDDGPRNVEAAAEFGIRTIQPVNGADWTQILAARLAE